MRATPVKRAAKASNSDGLVALAKLATKSRDAIMDDRDATIVQLQAQAQRHQAVFNAIAQGVCYFDAEDRVILSNRRFAESIGLRPSKSIRASRCVRSLSFASPPEPGRRPPTTIYRFASRTISQATRSSGGPNCRTAAWIQMRRQPIPGGGRWCHL